MKKTTLALLMTVFTASTLFSTVTQAEGPPGQQWHQQGGQDGNGGPGRGPDRGHDDRGGNQGHDGRGGNQGHDGRGGNQGHDGRGGNQGHDDRGHGDRGRGPGNYESGDRFAWQGHDFRRGQPLPPDFRYDDYRIDNWRERGLREPPRGERWAYIDGNYVLIAAATGVITSILLNGALH